MFWNKKPKKTEAEIMRERTEEVRKGINLQKKTLVESMISDSIERGLYEATISLNDKEKHCYPLLKTEFEARGYKVTFSDGLAFNWFTVSWAKEESRE